MLSQQVWCWGRDIIRPEGNWLLEIGFERIQPPVDRTECPSVYRLTLPQGRYVVLRGFGVFYGDPELGGVFLPRYEFQPGYTKQAKLDRPPWTMDDLPRVRRPTPSQQRACATLVSDLIDWVRRYEAHIIEQLGVEYRRATLTEWDNGSRLLVPAEEIASAWHALSLRVETHFSAFLKAAQAKPGLADPVQRATAWLRRASYMKPKHRYPTETRGRGRRPRSGLGAIMKRTSSSVSNPISSNPNETKHA